MSKKIYVCSDCGYVFPDELTDLIENNIKVYCEKCGTPFLISSGGKKPVKPKKKKREKAKEPTLHKIIYKLNFVAFLPIFIVSIVLICLSIIELSLLFIGIPGMIISLYDLSYVSPKIKKKQYDHIVADSICMGILGSIIFGTGVLLILKGLLVLIYAVKYPKLDENKSYDFGLKLKNSLNNISFVGAITIILYSIFWFVEGFLSLGKGIIIFLSIAGGAILLDLLFKKKIRNKYKFDFLDGLGVLILGVLSVMYWAAGIFILIKGTLIFILSFGKPTDYSGLIGKSEITIEKPIPEQIITAVEKLPQKPQSERRKVRELPHRTPIREVPSPKERLSPGEEKKEEIKREIHKLEEIKEQGSPKEIKTNIRAEKEIELKLNESLLPVKDKKDKKLVKEYFLKIFTVLSKDLRAQIHDLKIPKKDKKELLKELAFLTKEEQVKYIEAIINLYREELPILLIERIKKLPDVKPEHLAKIASQLKYMDYEEQLSYIEYLEGKA
ncbi:MAG: hypothetical protein GF353_13245 [Candidatus Lokiarchaeota archaeon]|nr:hypothetical protein [Candidatus Lokiarchaeota archaeon]